MAAYRFVFTREQALQFRGHIRVLCPPIYDRIGIIRTSGGLVLCTASDLDPPHRVIVNQFLDARIHRSQFPDYRPSTVGSLTVNFERAL